MSRLFVIVFAVVLFSCGSHNSVQSSYHGFANESWNSNEAVEIVLNIPDTALNFSLNSSIRYNAKYPFTSLIMNFALISPSGSSRFQTITVNLRNADGTLKGDKKTDYLNVDFTVYKSISFNETGQWNLIAKHEMPIDITRGLLGIEFELAPIDK